jgi:Tol biopolymer transport system component
MPLTAGTRLGPYEIIAPLGAGGMGEVYRATDTRLGRDVAIKVLPADVASDPDRLARFEREARAVSALNHPNIVTLYEVGTSDAGPYLVLENIEGRSLRDVLAEGPLPIRRILTLAAQIAEGVAKAHAAGIVHRDLKPDNIMVTTDGFAKVLDFGLAKLVFPELGAAPIAETTMAKDTGSGVVLGTLGYLSPEQASGKPADFRTDQFALGALMYEMATRERPFKRATMLESLTATIRDEPEPVRSKRPDVPAPLEWLIERCLSKDPNDRYASTSDLARDLASMRDRLSDMTRMPAGESRDRVRTIPRRLLGWTMGAAVVGAVAAGAFTWGRWTAPASVPLFRPLTFQPAVITGARFGSDERTVYYSAAYDDGPSRIYMTRLDRVESKPLELPPAFLLAVSAREELLILLTHDRSPYNSPGTVARVPAVGGTPRELVEDVVFADWSSDGERIAISRSASGCEFPLGRLVAPGCGFLRVSPIDDRVAFYSQGRVQIKDAELQEITSTDIPHTYGVAWTRDGREVWFTGSESGSPHDRVLYALSLDGRRRLVARAPGSMSVYDVARDRRSALIVTGALWLGVNAAIHGTTEERALDHVGRTEAIGLSADGKWALLNEVREVGRGTYLRSTDGRQLLRITDDIARGLSPDGSLALVQTRDRPPRLMLVPTRAGSPQDLSLNPGLEPIPEPGQWSRDGRRLFVWLGATGDTAGAVLHVRQDGQGWQPVTPRLPARPFAVSPDGATVAVSDQTNTVTLFPVGGGQAKRIEGERGRVFHWTLDGSLVLGAQRLFPAQLYRRDLSSGRVEPWRTLSPADPAGVVFIGRTVIGADDRSLIYTYARGKNELFLAHDLR